MIIKPIYQNQKAPCFSQDANEQPGCPALNDIPGFLYAISQRNFDLAFQILKRTNPFSGGCGRFCDHPCESACNRGKFDFPVNIRDLERFVSDYAFSKGNLPPKPKKVHNKTAAVIGGGPAGLSCAYFLQNDGFSVEVFEKEKIAGGMMAQGIPVFRYPTEVLKWELQYIEALGVKIHTNTKINNDDILKLHEKFDYLIIATGAHKSRRLGIPGEDNPCVMIGLDFLKQINLNDHFRRNNGDFSHVENIINGDIFAVIGGGYTAIDVARTASRLGKKVTVYYRRSQEDMNIHPGEIQECLKEGIHFEFYLNPYEISPELDSDGLADLTLEIMQPGEIGPDGKSTILPTKTFKKIKAHAIIKAIGETPDLKFLPEDYTINGNILSVNGLNKPFYIAGDARYGYAPDVGMVVKAIGSGRNTASDVMENHSKSKVNWYTENNIAYMNTIKTRYFKRQARLRPHVLKTSAAKKTFNEIILPVNDHEAVYAASRCFFCGICIQCDWCYHYANGAIAKLDKIWTGKRDNRYFSFISERVNLNTRNAVEACPRNAMALVNADQTAIVKQYQAIPKNSFQKSPTGKTPHKEDTL